jgi:hypothetical protein
MADNNINVGNATLTYTGQFVSVPFQADPIKIKVKPSAGARVTGSVTLQDPLKDELFDCGYRDQGIIKISMVPKGDILNPTILADKIEITVVPKGTAREGVVFSDDCTIAITFKVDAETYTVGVRQNFVAWSKPGEATTLVDRMNSAGQAPTECPGWVYRALQLEDYIILYGEHGITVMSPEQKPIPTFGFKTLRNFGIVSNAAVDGNTSMHYFISEKGDLWRLSLKNGPENLGFREFLSTLTDPVVMFDEHEDRVHIADGATGYVFDDGLGGGYGALTGVVGDLAISPAAISGVPISIMTDTLDLGHRGMKMVTFVEIGTDTTEDLYVALDYRYSKNEAWRTSSWILTNPVGVARLNITAVEFRVRVKQDTYDELTIDYINVRHQRADKRYLRGPLFEQPQKGQKT